MENHKYALPNPRHQLNLSPDPSSETHIFPCGITVVPRRISSRIRSTTDILRTVVTRARLIAQIDMDVRNVHNLDRRLATWLGAGGVGLGAHGDRVLFHGRPLAEAEDGQAEELGGARPDDHLAEVVGEDGALETDGSGALEVVSSGACENEQAQ